MEEKELDFLCHFLWRWCGS